MSISLVNNGSNVGTLHERQALYLVLKQLAHVVRQVQRHVTVQYDVQLNQILLTVVVDFERLNLLADKRLIVQRHVQDAAVDVGRRRFAHQLVGELAPVPEPRVGYVRRHKAGPCVETETSWLGTPQYPRTRSPIGSMYFQKRCAR